MSDIVLSNSTEDGTVKTLTIDCVTPTALSVTVLVDDALEDFQLLHYANTTVRDIALDRLVGNLVGDGFALVDGA